MSELHGLEPKSEDAARLALALRNRLDRLAEDAAALAVLGRPEAVKQGETVGV